MKRRTDLALIKKTDEECNDEVKILLIDVDSLKTSAHIDENVNDKDIRIAIKYVQDMIIEQVTGTCLFKSLKAMIEYDAIFDSQNSDYKHLLDEYLTDIFVWGVPAQLPIPLSYKIRNAGQIMTSSEGITNMQLDDMKYTNQWYRNKMDFYVNRAIAFLRCHTDCFEELCECCECGWYIRAMSKQPSVPINLKQVKPFRLKRGYHS